MFDKRFDPFDVFLEKYLFLFHFLLDHVFGVLIVHLGCRHVDFIIKSR